MTAGKQGKVRSRQKCQSWGGQRVSLERLPGYRVTLLLLNRGDPSAVALKEAWPVDSGARGGEKHSHSHGRPPFPVTTPHALTVLAFPGVRVLPKGLPVSCNSLGDIGCGKTTWASRTQYASGEDSKIAADGELQLKTRHRSKSRPFLFVSVPDWAVLMLVPPIGQRLKS
jgi:hypothetical protein